MQQEQFDIAIQLHGGGRYSNPFILKLGAKITVGTKTADATGLDINIPYIYYQNEILRWLEVVLSIGAKTADISPKLNPLLSDINQARKALGQIKPKSVIIHPGASDLRRRWSPHYFAKVGDWLVDQGYQVLLTGSDSEKQLISQVETNMHHPAINLSGRLSLSALVGLISLVDLIIANDTGPLHLAQALGTKAVGLFWCGNLINAGFITRTRYRPLSSWMVSCPLCHQPIASQNHPFKPFKKNCRHETSFVAEITVDQVVSVAQDLLSLQ